MPARKKAPTPTADTSTVLGASGLAKALATAVALALPNSGSGEYVQQTQYVYDSDGIRNCSNDPTSIFGRSRVDWWGVKDGLPRSCTKADYEPDSWKLYELTFNPKKGSYTYSNCLCPTKDCSGKCECLGKCSVTITDGFGLICLINRKKCSIAVFCHTLSL
jgi:hypothetical protein